MKKYLIILLFFFSCSSIDKNLNHVSFDCNENIKFKTEFFRNIKIIEDYITIESTTEFISMDEYELLVTDEMEKNYKLSLAFISKYAHVSFDSMANFDGSYPLGDFEEDKEGWLKWYNENKCNNIQFK